ncbi:ABC transporter ATP-binding protein [Paenactinomyces guangxiensis]|uniref:ABC transporter ATP-binding protein n=1 Tax=Paenactinomyces guangxiensis TaxID=1490290 RepID=A0A7W1WT08_9BACL|nr:ABC transporter ATP-binding protein [Paenactinomyces guangxiensis]MBA4495448.1 ABC transporter ATP-binding protein [Paenactinomyces guangxiensis]MBH8592429.1 ABC transporter ATP-binding protein [Paenactinomyces guangxiensis]
MIHAKGIWKVFGQGENRVEALRGVSLTIHKGEILAVMGPSGCGKTSLLNCLSGIDHISKGTVEIEGQNIHQMKEKEKDRYRAEKMGFVFQLYNLIPVLSAVENVELPLLSQGVRAKTARERAEEVLTRVGLRERCHHRPGEMSGGQAQRVALARAMVNQPGVIWADEPTGALDRETSKMILDLFEHFNRVDETTVVIVTHDPAVAERADRIIYMDSGRIVQERDTRRKVNSPVCMRGSNE